MAIKIGNTPLKKCYAGSTQIKKIFAGSTKVWSSETKTFAYVGNSGKNGYSVDTNNAITLNSAIQGINFASIAYGNGRFVAIPKGSYAKSYYSFDGVTWTMGDSCYFNSGIIFGGGYFIVHKRYSAAYSSDGITWRIMSDLPNVDYDLQSSFVDIIYAEGEYVAISKVDSYDEEDNQICIYYTWHKTSISGTWQGGAQLPYQDMYINGQCPGIIYRNGYFYTYIYRYSWDNGNPYRRETFYSENGITWSTKSSGYVSQNYAFNDIADNGTYIVLVGNGKACRSSSVDMSSFTQMTGISGNIFKVIYANGRFVATSSAGIFYCTDNSTWLAMTGDVLNFNGVSYGVVS